MENENIFILRLSDSPTHTSLWDNTNESNDNESESCQREKFPRESIQRLDREKISIEQSFQCGIVQCHRVENGFPVIGSWDSLETLPISRVDPVALSGSECLLEINVSEIHKRGCPNKEKGSHKGTTHRLVFKTCTTNLNESVSQSSNHSLNMRSSQKSFRLNEPAYFGQTLLENRSRVNMTPVLHQYKVEGMSFCIPGSFEKAHLDCLSQEINYKDFMGNILSLKRIIEETSSAVKASKSEKSFLTNYPVNRAMQAIASLMMPPISLSSARSFFLP
ncbi:hypothetical protein PPYR_06908 [Photinus pyralis]|uniref:Uncharacterized protein n=2 Tax=Photinus pyralis TaxID=7054 RepID=A0A5N4AP86_PHOPY|nr:hypothetical protein PPYR_06908 [Photinus pyralis]